MPQISRRHSTCLHAVSRDDPRRGPISLICFPCWNFIRSQAVASTERRFFSVISQADFEKSERYYTALGIAFALGRYEELELALWTIASQYVFDHPTLLSVADIDDLIIAAMRFSLLTPTSIRYAIEDSGIFVRERALTLGMRAISLNEGRRQSGVSDSGSIQLLATDSTVSDGSMYEEHLAAGLGSTYRWRRCPLIEDP